jgi:flagellar basal-body rod modification protein FlgD
MGAAIAGITTYDPSLGKTRTPSSSIDSDAFMQLLVAQLRYQDPMEAMDQNAFMQQIATMTSAQQQMELNDNLNTLVQNDATIKAFELIGRGVTALIGSEKVDGVVESVTIAEGGPILNLADGQTCGLADLFEVK